MEWVTTGRGSRAAAGYALPGLNKAIWSNLVSSLDSLSVKTSIQNKWSALCWSKTLWNSGLNTPGPPCNSACYGQMWGHPSLPGGVGSICRPLIDPCWSRGGAVWGPLVRQDSSLRPGHEDWLWSFFSTTLGLVTSQEWHGPKLFFLSKFISVHKIWLGCLFLGLSGNPWSSLQINPFS